MEHRPLVNTFPRKIPVKNTTRGVSLTNDTVPISVSLDPNCRARPSASPVQRLPKRRIRPATDTESACLREEALGTPNGRPATR